MLNHTNRFKITANIRSDGCVCVCACVEYILIRRRYMSLLMFAWNEKIKQQQQQQQKHPYHNNANIPSVSNVNSKEISIRPFILINLHQCSSLFPAASQSSLFETFFFSPILLNHNQRKLDLLKLKIINCSADRSEFVTVAFFAPLSLSYTRRNETG